MPQVPVIFPARDVLGLGNLDDAIEFRLLLGSEFGELDGQDAVLDLGTDALLVHVLGQHVGLLIIGVRELAAHIVMGLALFVIFLLILRFVLNLDYQVALVIDVD